MGKRGPQPKPPAERKSESINIRFAPGLRAQLDAARQVDGRSLSQEIETRLRLSLEAPEKEKEKFGGPTNNWLLRIIANQIKTVERFAGDKRWWEDVYTFNQVQLLVDTFLEFFRPDGEEIVPDSLARWEESLGRHMAIREMANIQAAALDPNPPLGQTWGGMAVSEWCAAAAPLLGKLRRPTPLHSLYGKDTK
jgi:hypothetical protein